MTFAIGPSVAASKGIAVEQNHQSCGSSSSSGRMRHVLDFVCSRICPSPTPSESVFDPDLPFELPGGDVTAAIVSLDATWTQ